MSPLTSHAIIELLQLKPHPREGGYFAETHRTPEPLIRGHDGAKRSIGTAIYYLLTRDTHSTMHRLPGDEIFHHYLGAAVEWLILLPSGESKVAVLGGDLAAHQRPQCVVPGGAWQSGRIIGSGDFALLGTTMAPGFDFADYEHGDIAALTARYPSEAARLAQLA